MARILWIDLMSLPHRRDLARVASRRHEVQVVDRPERASHAIARFRAQLACIEFDYPDAARLKVLTDVRQASPTLPVVMFTQFHSEALAVWAFRTGVDDYRVKPVADDVLVKIIDLFAMSPNGVTPHRGARAFPPELIEPAGHLLRPPRAARKRSRRSRTSPNTFTKTSGAGRSRNSVT